MCGISGFEFTVIMIAAIIVLGPEKLPEVLRMFGKLTKQIRRWKGDLGDIAKDVQSSIPVEQIRKEMSEGLDIDRARTRLKETESEIDALRSRLKAKVAEEEADIDRAIRGGAQPEAIAGPEPTLDAPVEPTLDAPVQPTIDAATTQATSANDSVGASATASANAGPTARPLPQAAAGASLIGAGVDDDYGTAPSAPLPSIKQAAHIKARASASVITPAAAIPTSISTPEGLPSSMEAAEPGAGSVDTPAAAAPREGDAPEPPA